MITKLHDFSKTLDQLFQETILNKNQTLHKKFDILNEAMVYSMLGGKKFRAYLFYITYNMLAGNNHSLSTKSELLNLSIAIESIHVYSLIHDDLPALDDDDYRRHKLSSHKQFDEATAILTGNSLLTLFFSLISNNKLINDSQKVKIINLISHNIGYEGMMKGQIMDLAFESMSSSELNYEIIKEMNILKSANLIKSSALIASICTNQNEVIENFIKDNIEKLGISFQIKDDLLDVESNNQTLGKETQKDSLRKKINIVNFFGLKEAQNILKRMTDEIIDNFIKFDQTYKTNSSEIIEIINFNFNRKL